MIAQPVDMCLAVLLALIPLLPTGPEYLGFSAASWTDLGLVLLVVLWLVSRWSSGGARLVSDREGQPDTRVVGWAWFTLVVTVTGSAAVAVATDNEVGSPAFWAHLWDLRTDLFRPMNMATHPLYAIRVWLNFLEGFVGFVLVFSICAHASDPARRGRAAVWGALPAAAWSVCSRCFSMRPVSDCIRTG